VFRAIVYSPDGKTIITADGRFIRLWEAATGRPISQFAGHGADVSALATAPDGKMLASQDEDATLILWNIRAGREVRRFPGLATNLEARIKAQKHWFPGVAFARNGDLIAACDERGLGLWEIATGRAMGHIAKLRSAIRSLCVSPDGKTLAGSDDRGACLWDVASGRELASSPHAGAAALAFSPAGHMLATGEQNAIGLWNMETGRLLRQLRPEKNLNLDVARFASVAFAPDGKTLAAECDDGVVRLWNTATGALVGHIQADAEFPSELAFAPDGKSLAMTAANATALIWDLSSSLN
jgi:WD40 repeat protein